MKRLFVVLLALVFTMSTVVVTALAEETAYTKIGYYSNEVLLLHRKLAELGYYSLRPESPWSAKSADALKILQENMGWEITGTVADKEMYDAILSLENVVGKNLLLGTNQGTTNFRLLDKGFNATLEADEDGVKVTSTTRDDSGWLVLFFDDGQSREILAGPAGAWFTLSFEAKSNVENADMWVAHRQTNAAENQINFGDLKLGEADVWKEYVLTGRLIGVAATSQGLYFDMRYGNPAGTEIEIRNLKLEKGSQATEWSKAPED